MTTIFGPPSEVVIWSATSDVTPSNDLVAVGKSNLHGIGCFAKCDLRAGVVLSCSPVIFIWGDDEMRAIEATGIGGYPFEWGDCVNDDGEEEPLYCFSLGIGAIYNHSGSPNCYYAMVEAGEDFYGRSFVCPTLVHIAKRDISQGEELTTDYSGEGQIDLWFQPTGEDNG